MRAAGASERLSMSYTCLQTRETSPGLFDTSLVSQSLDHLPDHDVLIRVRWSSLNYKDALSANGNRGVTRQFPHTPGIDAAGEIVASRDTRFAPGMLVLVTGFGLGMNTPGGLSQYISVPADWVIPLPAHMSARTAMSWGTAGLTAALCVEKLLRQGIQRDAGPILVTGATGGVGAIAVALLSHLGFDVVASTGKPDKTAWLQSLGARDVIDRISLGEPSGRPLLSARWQGAVDTVGGHTLVNVLKSTCYGGSVACCGLVESHELPGMSVMPFILRGVQLLGVDSVECPLPHRQALWEKIAAEWQLPVMESLVTEVLLTEAPHVLKRMLVGASLGRCVVRVD